MSQESEHYNVYEKDIAVVNIFFGSSTVFGLEKSFIISDFKSTIKYRTAIPQNLRDLKGWPGWTSSQTLEDSVDFVLESVSFLSQNFYIGSPSGFSGQFQTQLFDFENQ